MSARGRNAIVGLGALALLGLVAWLMALYLGGAFKSGFEVSARFERAGQLMRAGSDVKARGVLVGEVSGIDVSPDGEAFISMRIFPDQRIPEDAVATIRAKTLFGEKYIDLSFELSPDGPFLTAGDRIAEDSTVDPFEVETILRRSVPLLRAIDPENLAVALDALAQGFVGNEEALRNATVQGEQVLTETRRTLPNLERNLVHFRNFAETLDEVDSDLLSALADLEVAGRSLDSHSEEFAGTLSSLVPLSTDLADIFEQREQDLSDLSRMGRAVLGEFHERRDEIPTVIRLLDGFLGVWIADLTAGPYWRILVTNEPTTATPYPPGQEPGPRGQEGPVRTDLLRRLSGDPAAPPPSLVDVFLAPVPTETLGDVAERVGAVLPEGVGS